MKQLQDKFTHLLTVKLTTQFPQDPNNFCSRIQTMLGPWCIEVNANSLNECGRKYTSEELDPMSDEYVGHYIALEHGVKCCCAKSVINCPFHGR